MHDHRTENYHRPLCRCVQLTAHKLFVMHAQDLILHE